jgi:YHS domain-containing protein
MSSPIHFLPQRILLLAVAATFCVASTAFAQSTTRTVRQGSTAPRTVATKVALQGYCPVCVIKMKKWVRGNSSIQATYDGKTYYFPGEEQKQMFMADPAAYVPALGGDCSVCLTDMGQRMQGSVHFAALSGDRLYLFPNEEIKQKFRADPAKYINADLAMGGNCAVCRVEMNKNVAGNPNVSHTFGGFRYLFPSDDQRKMFIANPTKYAVKQAGGGSTTK